MKTTKKVIKATNNTTPPKVKKTKMTAKPKGNSKC